MATLTRESRERDDGVVQPRLGPVGWLRFLWRRLTSMSTALVLLLLLAVAAVPGSVVPQRRVDPAAVARFLQDNPSAGIWLDRLSFFDVYSSPWFAAVYLLLSVSLVGCVVPRARVHYRALRAAPPRTPRRLERLPAYVVAGADDAPDAVLAAARAALRRRRYRVAAHEDERGASVAAERGHLAETGNLVFHLALLGVLVGVAAGALYSWNGQAVVVVGQGFSNTLPMYNVFRPGARVDPARLPPFSFTLDDLQVAFDDEATGSQFGAPRRFDATVTVRATPDARPQRRLVRPNEPLDVDGARAFIVGNGYAPVVTVRDGNGDVAFSGPVPFQPRDGQYTSVGVVKVPDAAPRQLAFSGVFLPTAVLDPRAGPISVFPDARTPRLVLTAWAGDPGEDDIGLDAGVPQSVYQLDTTDLTQLRAEDGEALSFALAPGESVTLPDGAGAVSFDGLRRFAAFDVHHDPSRAWVLTAAVVALAGLMLTLFVRRRRLWVRASSDGAGRTVVEVAGLARGQDDALAEEVRQVLAHLAPAATADPVVRE